MTGKVAYINARVIDPASGLDAPATAKGGVLTDGTRIMAIGPDIFSTGSPAGAEIVDCEGAVLTPGLVDMRVDFCEPGNEHKEDIESGSRAAAAGGVTAVVTLPDTDPAIDDASVLEFVARRARDVKLVKVFAYGTITRKADSDEIVEMGLMKQAGAVAFTNGRSAVANAKTLSRALKYAQAFDALIVQHPEESSLSNGGVMQSGELATRLGLPGIPREAETIMIDRDLALVKMTGGRYHAAHISTAESVAKIRVAKAAGLRVTCDTAPPYFALNELAVGEYRTFAKLSPPLRTEEDRQAIVAGLADGTIDCIASDHLPQDQESKRLPFEQAEFGAAGLESLLPLTLELVHNEHLGLSDALAKVTNHPAELLKLPVGRLHVGGAADIVIFDPERPGRIEPDNFTSKSKNSPFDGRLVQGRVIRTIVDGRTIYTAAS
ncbi:MAG: dihydroorotase [Rhodospirillaceae bacterium]|jgi:dihydroorotase|nr:dihydroorotase [Rhodospirillaceae bacterium]MBT3931577.1 dihydroorotase [Rhodospirillaceae bacterium]MBT4773901.1 dihydroorotase [Rhodospirillaceae bacterium]MBT5357468.1 dihydroorotase [Rhodospirillaceae bacterium]MBT5770479.1 dihydroorotase [Rhodospirillaceae bacterium]